MAEVWRWGIDFIIAVQPADAPVLDLFFMALTVLGSGEFFLALFPLVLWCVDERAGSRLLVFFLVSAQLNLVLKTAFQHPRPIDLVPELQRVPTSGYGLPSGHAQGAMVIWGTLAVWSRRRPVRLLFVSLVLLIGLSRVYLGVHFPTDVLAGWLVGGVLLVAFVRGLPALEAWLARRFVVQVAVAVAVPTLLLAVGPLPESAMVAGVLLGAGLGIAASSRWFTLAAAAGSTGQRVGRYLAGQAILVPAYLGVRWGVGDEGVLLPVAGYALLGVLMTFGIPRLLVRWGLARRGRPVDLQECDLIGDDC